MALALFLTVVQFSDTYAKTITINLDSLNKVCSFNRFDQSSDDERRWVQGFAATEKYCVFGYVNKSESYSHIIVLDRESDAIVADHDVGWGHVNSMHYDWQNKQIWVEGGECLNGMTAAIEQCRIMGPKKYLHDESITYQGRDAVNDVGFMAMSDTIYNNLAKIWLCEATSDCSSPQHEIVIHGFKLGELEDISFDKNGDVLVSFNRWNRTIATAEVYRIDKSVFVSLGVDTVPVDSASTINADGSTGGALVVLPTTVASDDKDAADLSRLLLDLMAVGAVLVGMIADYLWLRCSE